MSRTSSSLPRRSLVLTLVMVLLAMMTVNGQRGMDKVSQDRPDPRKHPRKGDFVGGPDTDSAKQRWDKKLRSGRLADDGLGGKTDSEKKRYTEERRAFRESLKNKTDSSKKRARQAKQEERKRLKAERDRIREEEGLEL